MATVQVSVCDVCADPTREVETYTITRKGERVILDLCDEHATPIEEAAAGRWAKSSSTSRRIPSGRRPGRPAEDVVVTTMEEVERLRRPRTP